MLVAGRALAGASFEFGVADGFHFEPVIAEVANQEMSLDGALSSFSPTYFISSPIDHSISLALQRTTLEYSPSTKSA